MPEKQIVLFDADGSRGGVISEAECERLVNDGLGFAVRSSRGEIKKFFCHPRRRIHLHGASQTTRPVKADGSGRAAAGQFLGHPRHFREHRA